MMVRFILLSTYCDEHVGISTQGHFTIEADCPAVEEQISRSGRRTSGFDLVQVIGAEIVSPAPTAKEWT